MFIQHRIFFNPLILCFNYILHLHVHKHLQFSTLYVHLPLVNRGNPFHCHGRNCVVCSRMIRWLQQLCFILNFQVSLLRHTHTVKVTSIANYLISSPSHSACAVLTLPHTYTIFAVDLYLFILKPYCRGAIPLHSNGSLLYIKHFGLFLLQLLEYFTVKWKSWKL